MKVAPPHIIVDKSRYHQRPRPAAMQIGSGCTIYLRADELPSGRLVVSVSKHLTAVVTGVIHDTHTCSRGETRCVYGYWQQVGGR